MILNRLQGVWKQVYGRYGENEWRRIDESNFVILEIKSNQYTVTHGSYVLTSGEIHIDAAQDPWTVDFFPPFPVNDMDAVSVMRGIGSVQDDVLVLCTSDENKRPSIFRATRNAGLHVYLREASSSESLDTDNS